MQYSHFCICQMVGWAILAHFCALAFLVPGKREKKPKQNNMEGCLDKPFSKPSLQSNQSQRWESCSELIRLSSKCLSSGCIINSSANICCWGYAEAQCFADYKLCSTSLILCFNRLLNVLCWLNTKAVSACSFSFSYKLLSFWGQGVFFCHQEVQHKFQISWKVASCK